MDTHFYLRATVTAYEDKFANLVELLPEKEPSKQVWNNIESHIKQSSVEKITVNKEEKSPWWQMDFFKKGFSMAAMALIVSAVYFYDPMNDHKSTVEAYSAVMESSDGGKPMAFTKIKKSSMQLTIEIMKPMNSQDEYNNLKNVGQLEVSIEKIGDTNIKSPSNRIILKGQLKEDGSNS